MKTRASLKKRTPDCKKEEPQVQDASGLIFMLNKHKKVAEYQKFCVPLHAF